MVKLIAIVLLSLVAACEPANIMATHWDSAGEGMNVKTRCERVDMRNKEAMDKLFPQYDGWKVIYISEYTTTNQLGTDGVVCFERSK
jgi:hypothetical protein